MVFAGDGYGVSEFGISGSFVGYGTLRPHFFESFKTSDMNRNMDEIEQISFKAFYFSMPNSRSCFPTSVGGRVSSRIALHSSFELQVEHLIRRP
ncbi:hypothetical protein SCA6_005090 [Theobroma cacao]